MAENSVDCTWPHAATPKRFT